MTKQELKIKELELKIKKLELEIEILELKRTTPISYYPYIYPNETGTILEIETWVTTSSSDKQVFRD